MELGKFCFVCVCLRHYHSMEVFAHFDIINSFGVKVAEGHKASFCLEDNQCTHNTEPVYKCANYGDQGISVNCTDTYHHNIDCQWIDITDIEPVIYTFKVLSTPTIAPSASLSEFISRLRRVDDGMTRVVTCLFCAQISIFSGESLSRNKTCAGHLNMQ